MCSRPVKIPKLDVDVLQSIPNLGTTQVLKDSDPVPVPTSSQSSLCIPLHSHCSSPDSSEIKLVLEAPHVSANINTTLKLQTIIDSLDDAMEDEIDRVQKRFYRQKRPYFEERRTVLESIPGFWRTTFLSHPDLASIMATLDNEILKYLSSVDILEYSDGDCAYKVSFSFNENPFFYNYEFTKEVRLMDSDELVSIGTKIKWKEPYVSLNKRVKSGTKRGQNEPHCEFFIWFSSSNSKYLDRIGEILKDDIWPNPMKYFFNKSRYTEQLVVLSDSGSETQNDHIQFGDRSTKNSDVISIDDDEDYELNYIDKSFDNSFGEQTSKLINGELFSPVLDSPAPDAECSQVKNTIINNIPLCCGLSPDLFSFSESATRPSNITIIINSEDNQPTSPSSQSQIMLEIQQESEV